MWMGLVLLFFLSDSLVFVFCLFSVIFCREIGGVVGGGVVGVGVGDGVGGGEIGVGGWFVGVLVILLLKCCISVVSLLLKFCLMVLMCYMFLKYMLSNMMVFCV